MLLRKRHVLVLLGLLALAQASAAHAYSWPIKPFGRQHPIRGNFGDPRTIFSYSLSSAALFGPGDFSFHNGVDIAARPYTRVYPVMSGTVRFKNDLGLVIVDSPDGYTFQYDHLEVMVEQGQEVVAHRTLLGYVQNWAAHVHLTEIRFGHVQNPAQPGHLTPFRDHTRPRIEAIGVRNYRSRDEAPLGVHGRVQLIAEIYDNQPMRVPGVWAGMPLVPSTVSWRLDQLYPKRKNVVPLTKSVDFSESLPSNRQFWRIYARGTYQNMPRFGTEILTGMPGRFLFRLNPELLDTRNLKNGVYSITVFARDERGNVGRASMRIAIENPRTHSP